MNLKGIAPVLLTITGCIATVGAVVLAVYETPGAVKRLDDHRLQIDPSGESDLCLQEKVVDYAVSYKFTGLCTAAALGCSIASCVMLKSDCTKLLSLAAIGGTAYTSKYRNRVKQIIGEEKEKLLDAQVRKELKDDSQCYDKECWFYLPLYDEATNKEIEGISFKASMGDIQAQQIKLLYGVGDCEVVTLFEAFPQIKKVIKKDDPRWPLLDRMWHQDVLYDGYQVMLPHIDYEKWNFNEGSEDNKRFDPNLNNGEPTRVIRTLESPEPPQTIMLMDC